MVASPRTPLLVSERRRSPFDIIVHEYFLFPPEGWSAKPYLFIFCSRLMEVEEGQPGAAAAAGGGAGPACEEGWHAEVVAYLAQMPGVVVGSQQRGEEDPSAAAKAELLAGVLARSPAEFLMRWGSALQLRHLQPFESLGLYAVSVRTKELRQTLTPSRHGKQTRNRRLMWMQRMLEEAGPGGSPCPAPILSHHTGWPGQRAPTMVTARRRT